MSGLTFNVKSEVNESSIKSDINGKIKQVQAPLDAMIMSDSNYFCPIKTGKLEQSAVINSKIGTGVLLWRTPYARRQYYDYHKPPYQPNPNACGRWFEAAKARWLNKWINFINERLKRS